MPPKFELEVVDFDVWLSADPDNPRTHANLEFKLSNGSTLPFLVSYEALRKLQAKAEKVLPRLKLQ